jgi:hypothetical protein
MTTFYATYSAATASGLPVTATQGTVPWVVSGQGTAGVAATGVVTVQGITSGTPIPISGSITATNPSVGTTGSAVPASATMIGGTDGTNLRAAHISAGGLVSVDGSGVTQPVSGTVAVSGTVTVSGSVTANAGTNLNTSALALDASVTGLQVAQASTTSGQKGGLTLGAVTTAAPSYTTAQSSPLSLTTGGALRVDASGSTQPVSGTVAVTQSTSPWIVAGGGTAGTAATGVVTIQGIASGTVVPVTVSTVAPVTTTTAVFQAEGAVAFGSVTNSYVTLFTPTAATKMLQMRNNTNAAISVSMDAGSTTNYTLDAGDAISLDLLANSLNMGATAIQIKYAVGAPTSGSFRINGAH